MIPVIHRDTLAPHRFSGCAGFGRSKSRFNGCASVFTLQRFLSSDGNTVAWYRSQIGQTNDGAGLCSSWANQIGAAGALTAATTARPTIQSDGSLLFDGTANIIRTAAFTLNQPETIYVVFSLISWVGNADIIDGVTQSSGVIFCNTSTPNFDVYAGANLGNNATLTVGTSSVVTVVINGASSSSQVDSATKKTGNAGAANMGGITLGAGGGGGNFSNIQVKELIVRSVADNATTQSLIQGYLKAIYGTP